MCHPYWCEQHKQFDMSGRCWSCDPETTAEKAERLFEEIKRDKLNQQRLKEEAAYRTLPWYKKVARALAG